MPFGLSTRSGSQPVVVDRREVNGDSELIRGALQIGVKANGRRLARQLQLGGQDREPGVHTGAETNDVGAVACDDAGDLGNDPGSVSPLDPQRIEGATGLLPCRLAEHPGVDDQRTA
jgi:hypothetical protein